jgi:uncharacterized caspase-like protein
VQQAANREDVLLVYLAGHGINVRSERDGYYYLTTDARMGNLDDSSALRNTTVSSQELSRWLRANDMPLKQILILDTCAAGAIDADLLGGRRHRDVPSDQQRAMQILKDSTGTVVLMGAAADQVSYEFSKYGGGLLTYALLNGMRGRSVNPDHRLTVVRWFTNASEDVQQLAFGIGGVQRP